MTTFDIKLIAIITMVIDHVGQAFFPQLIILRAIGRLAFPLFAWLIANGAYYTKNIEKYLQRLFIFALISQIPYKLFIDSVGIVDVSLNIFFTLFLGLLLIFIYRKTANKFLTIALAIVLALIAQKTKMDFGYIGVLSIVCFYFLFNNFKLLAVSQFIIFTFPSAWEIYSTYFNTNLPIPSMMLLQPLAVLSLIFVYQYNKKKGISGLKYFFYLFYPVHLLIIYLFKVFL